MADRTVTVNLVARLIGYVTPLRREAIPATKDLRQESDKLTAASKLTERALSGVGGEARQTARHIDHLGGEVRETTREMERMGTAWERVQAKLRISRAANVAGTAVGRATRGGGSAIGGIGQVGLSNPKILAALIGAGVVASPAIGAAVVAGTGLGVGLGAVGGGIALAADNREVQAAYTVLGSKIATHMRLAAERAFVEPLVRGADELDKSWSKISDNADRILAKSAKAVEPLARGVGGLFEKMAPGLERFVDTATPLVQDLAAELPELGDAIGDMFNSFSKGGPGAIAFLDDLLDITEGTIRAFGKMTEGLTRFYSLNNDLSPLKNLILDGQLVEGVHGAVLGMDHAISLTGETAAEAAARVALLASNMEDLNDQFQESFRLIHNSRGAAIDYEQAIDDLTESIKENGRTLDIGTDKGRANARQLEVVFAETIKTRDAAIAAGHGTAEATAAANAKYAEQIARLEHLLRELGYTPAAIAAIVDAYKRIPTDVYTTVHVNFRYVETNDPNRFRGGFNRWGGVYEHAEHGLLRQAEMFGARSPGRYVIAEPATGGEAFVPRLGDRGRSTAILQQAAGWYGQQVVPKGAGGWYGSGGGTQVIEHRHTVTLESPGLLEGLRKEIQVQGGDVQAALGWG